MRRGDEEDEDVFVLTDDVLFVLHERNQLSEHLLGLEGCRVELGQHLRTGDGVTG